MSTSVIYTLSLHYALFFFFKDPAPTEISPLPLHDALPIWPHAVINFERYESALREATNPNDAPLSRRHDIMSHWAESGLFALMPGEKKKLPLVASRLYD